MLWAEGGPPDEWPETDAASEMSVWAELFVDAPEPPMSESSPPLDLTSFLIPAALAHSPVYAATPWSHKVLYNWGSTSGCSFMADKMWVFKPLYDSSKALRLNRLERSSCVSFFGAIMKLPLSH